MTLAETYLLLREIGLKDDRNYRNNNFTTSSSVISKVQLARVEKDVWDKLPRELRLHIIKWHQKEQENKAKPPETEKETSTANANPNHNTSLLQKWLCGTKTTCSMQSWTSTQ